MINHFDHDDLLAYFSALICPEGHVGAQFHGPNRTHYAEIRCEGCNHFHGWMSMPRQLVEQKRRRSDRVPLPVGEDFCWICNVTAEVLDAMGMKLEGAHPRDRAARLEAGLDPEDDRTFPVCTYHHRWIDREREQARRWLSAIQAYDAITTGLKDIA